MSPDPHAGPGSSSGPCPVSGFWSWSWFNIKNLQEPKSEPELEKKTRKEEKND